MGVHIFKRDQVLKGREITEVWDFFSNPENLKTITPDYMGFDIVSTSNSDEMYAGQIIRYVVRPLARIPMHWTTEITQVKPPYFFIDEQKQGPYKLWHHQHKFTPVSNGVLMEDIIHYQPPFGVLGDALNKLFIRKRLKDIFDYRKRVIKELLKVDE
jgi:ligand-binding SRPBCC domain-containing protein